MSAEHPRLASSGDVAVSPPTNSGAKRPAAVEECLQNGVFDFEQFKEKMAMAIANSGKDNQTENTSRVPPWVPQAATRHLLQRGGAGLQKLCVDLLSPGVKVSMELVIDLWALFLERAPTLERVSILDRLPLPVEAVAALRERFGEGESKDTVELPQLRTAEYSVQALDTCRQLGVKHSSVESLALRVDPATAAAWSDADHTATRHALARYILETFISLKHLDAPMDSLIMPIPGTAQQVRTVFGPEQLPDVLGPLLLGREFDSVCLDGDAQLPGSRLPVLALCGLRYLADCKELPAQMPEETKEESDTFASHGDWLRVKEVLCLRLDHLHPVHLVALVRLLGVPLAATKGVYVLATKSLDLDHRDRHHKALQILLEKYRQKLHIALEEGGELYWQPDFHTLARGRVRLLVAHTVVECAERSAVAQQLLEHVLDNTVQVHPLVPGWFADRFTKAKRAGIKKMHVQYGIEGVFSRDFPSKYTHTHTHTPTNIPSLAELLIGYAPQHERAPLSAPSLIAHPNLERLKMVLQSPADIILTLHRAPPTSGDASSGLSIEPLSNTRNANDAVSASPGAAVSPLLPFDVAVLQAGADSALARGGSDGILNRLVAETRMSVRRMELDFRSVLSDSRKIIMRQADDAPPTPFLFSFFSENAQLCARARAFRFESFVQVDSMAYWLQRMPDAFPLIDSICIEAPWLNTTWHMAVIHALVYALRSLETLAVKIEGETELTQAAVDAMRVTHPVTKQQETREGWGRVVFERI